MSNYQIHETPVNPRLFTARAVMEAARAANFQRYSAARARLWAAYQEACKPLHKDDTAGRDKAWLAYETGHAKAYAAYRADAAPYIDAYEAAKAALVAA
jgi:hypothetical protein